MMSRGCAVLNIVGLKLLLVSSFRGVVFSNMIGAHTPIDLIRFDSVVDLIWFDSVVDLVRNNSKTRNSREMRMATPSSCRCMQVKRKKARHAGMFEIARTQNRPMIHIGGWEASNGRVDLVDLVDLGKKRGRWNWSFVRRDNWVIHEFGNLQQMCLSDLFLPYFLSLRVASSVIGLGQWVKLDVRLKRSFLVSTSLLHEVVVTSWKKLGREPHNKCGCDNFVYNEYMLQRVCARHTTHTVPPIDNDSKFFPKRVDEITWFNHFT